jgi:hypothetical protein
MLERAAEESENSTARYVMLTDAIGLAAKGGEIDLAVQSARQIDKDFDAPQLREVLATAFVDSYGGKEFAKDFRDLANGELSALGAPLDQLALGEQWLEVAKSIPSHVRLPALRRARQCLVDSMASPDLKGLARTEAEKAFHNATIEMDRIDARAGRFTLYAGKWAVHYDNKYVHEYVISADGTLAFDRCISPDGTAFVKKDEQRAKLIRRGAAVLAPFAGGKLVERFSLKGDKLIVERFDPASLYPKSAMNKGEGVKEAGFKEQ